MYFDMNFWLSLFIIAVIVTIAQYSEIGIYLGLVIVLLIALNYVKGEGTI